MWNVAAVGRCRSCGRRIVWAETTIGKRMPVDVEPSDNGNVELIEDGGGTIALVLRNDEIGSARNRGALLYLSHFATCPNAKRHRRA